MPQSPPTYQVSRSIPGPVREPGIAPGHLNILMTQELLETFQAHSRIEQLRSERVTKTMHRLALRFKSGLLDIFYEPAPSGTVADGFVAPPVKDKLLVLIPSAKPEF